MNMNTLSRVGIGLLAGAMLTSAATATVAFPGDIRPGHMPLGRYYGIWTTDTGDVLNNSAGDTAYMWKDLELTGGAVILALGFDDGAVVYWNGQVVLDHAWTQHGVGYWDAVLDLTGLILPGRNRLTIQVFNTCHGGSGDGGLDLTLTVDDIPVMPLGSSYPFDPANEIWYTGVDDCSQAPLLDDLDREWWEADYGWTPDVVAADDAPQTFALTPAYPNPFNPGTTISYSLAEATEIHLSVFNLLGREVAVLRQGLTGRGGHQVNFDAAGLPGGVYFVHLQAEGRSATQKILLLK